MRPTMIRTGTGFIDVAAANDIGLLDPTAPGVIYTAGRPAAGSPQGTSESVVVDQGSEFGSYDLLATTAVNPVAAGDISIHAQNDIMDVESVSGVNGGNANGPGSGASQFWWQWMQTGNVTGLVGAANPTSQTIQSSINFGAFDQGIMSVGGNVTISASGNIVNLAVSLPTSWYLTNANTDNPTVNTVGGGNLAVTAGGNILSGDYFVANGTGTLTAGGLIGSSGLIYTNSITQKIEVSTLLAAQNGAFNISARQGIDIGGVFDPSYLQGAVLPNGFKLVGADAQSYSASSAVNAISTTGDVAFNTLTSIGLVSAGDGPATGSGNDYSYVLPATVDLTAFTGGITIARDGELYPSATGQLSLVAAQSINLYNASNDNLNFFGLIDASSSALPSPLKPIPRSLQNQVSYYDGVLTSSALVDHSQIALHGADTQPALIYSLTGSINDGILNNDGNYADILQVAVDKPAQIQAAQSIFNLAFLGQNLRNDDITSIVAGTDIYDTRNLASESLGFIAPALAVGGPGVFDVEAGRNIGPLTSQAQVFAVQGTGAAVTGIDAIGNADNPYLPHESANVQVLFGVGKGIDNAAFIADYVAPGASIPGIDTTTDLIAFMEQYDAGHGIDTGLTKDNTQVTLTGDQAWQQFQALPVAVQQLFDEQILFKVLTVVGQNFHDPSSPFVGQYSRGYQAINTLFPASLGYTANGLAGGDNGASGSPIQTGNLDIRSTTIQTQQGGNVNILGPGGAALIGSADAPPVITDSQWQGCR